MSQPTAETLLSAPDQVLVLSAEEFLKTIQAQLEKVPFVALNCSRSYMLEPEAGKSGHTFMALAAIGFAMEDIREVPNLMASVTAHPTMVLATREEDQEIKAAIEKELDIEMVPASATDPLPIIDPPLPASPASHPEIDSDNTLMKF